MASLSDTNLLSLFTKKLFDDNILQKIKFINKGQNILDMRRQGPVQPSQTEAQAPVQQPPQVLSPNLPEIKGLYRDVTVYIRDNFFPHYNLYQVIIFVFL